MAKVKAPTFTTCRGVFKYPRLGEPDTKFKAEGEYSVKFITTRADMGALLDKLEVMHADAVKRGKAAYAALPVATRKKLDQKGGFTANPLFNVVYDEAEEETGEIEFNFKLAASGTYKSGPKAGETWTRKPAIFDAGTKPMKGDKIWGGSEGKVSFEVGIDKDGSPGYFIPGTGAAGLSLRLQAVQVLDLVSGGQRNAGSFGFGAEDGYSSADEDTSEEAAANGFTNEGTASVEDDEIPF